MHYRLGLHRKCSRINTYNVNNCIIPRYNHLLRVYTVLIIRVVNGWCGGGVCNFETTSESQTVTVIVIFLQPKGQNGHRSSFFLDWMSVEDRRLSLQLVKNWKHVGFGIECCTFRQLKQTNKQTKRVKVDFHLHLVFIKAHFLASWQPVVKAHFRINL